GENGTLIESSGFALSNYLSGQCAGADQIIRDSGIEGLSVIDSGPLPANPAELFSSERMKGLLEYCKSNFDYVILDGPATLVSDSKTLAAQAGTVLMGVKTRKGGYFRENYRSYQQYQRVLVEQPA
ncbi:MAG: P-loop NTPase family protein, partial [Planctomycetota bacterium]